MKFLLINKMKDAALALPPAVSRQLMEATVAWVKQKMQAGVCLESYTIAGGHGSMAIVEYKSGEELARDFIQMPVGSFMDFEVYPLADFDESMNAYIEALKAAEKMMPGPPG